MKIYFLNDLAMNIIGQKVIPYNLKLTNFFFSFVNKLKSRLHLNVYLQLISFFANVFSTKENFRIQTAIKLLKIRLVS